MLDAAIDYEAEYNNRARVPEWPQHFAQWAADAKAFREAFAGRSELGVSYGPTARQTIDLFFSDKSDDAPLAVFVHGGWFKSLEPQSFSHLAGGLVPHGVTVAIPGYDLAPGVTIAEIVDEIRQCCLHLWRRFKKPMMVYGHSAGGHLAAAMVATDFSALDKDAPAALVPSGYAVSGIFDMTPILKISANEDFKLTQESAMAVSPALWPVAKGRRFDADVGGIESNEFLRQSRTLVDAWAAQGAITHYGELAGENHFSVVPRLAEPDGPVVKRLLGLLA